MVKIRMIRVVEVRGRERGRTMCFPHVTVTRLAAKVGLTVSLEAKIEED